MSHAYVIKASDAGPIIDHCCTYVYTYSYCINCSRSWEQDVLLAYVSRCLECQNAMWADHAHHVVIHSTCASTIQTEMIYWVSCRCGQSEGTVACSSHDLL